MPRKYSLRYRKDFKELFTKGKKLYTKNFSLTYLKAEELKFGFIVTKKTSKKAHDRNYSKRVLREIIRKEIIPNFESNYHIALMCKKSLNTLKEEIGYEGIKSEIIYIFSLLKKRENL